MTLHMKKNIFSLKALILIYFTTFFILSCRTNSNLVTFSQKEGNLIFIKPVEIKNSAVPLFSIDFTASIKDGNIINTSSLKYSIAENNISRKFLEDLFVEIIYGDNNIALSHKTLYIENYKNTGIKIRFESELSPDEAMAIINTEEPLLFHIFNDDNSFSKTIPLKKFKDELNTIRIYF